jgi:hypothetical protein
MYTLDLQVTRKQWMSHPKERWNAGLERMGLNFRQGLQVAHYPAVPPGSRYVRTHILAKKANFRILEPGRVMEYGSTTYLTHLLKPAPSVAHWGGKRAELLDTMRKGFASGIKNFKG